MDNFVIDEQTLPERADSEMYSSLNSPTSNNCYGCRRHYKLWYKDENVKERYDQIVRAILRLANTNEISNNALLAQKACKYRNLLRSNSVNFDDPSLDVFESLGITWCKTTL
ncbi:hypothetical protein THRCLA_21019 [Thraustotheca clavata]|uniref:Uncharacterized protein n=1 Tax=Thraustotheca clavata TaxID=74557 RepID=A0A1W0A0Y4_9STRA|nr:hypothetical protein THRCLA_21019 [Thraustotheca clavata]